MEKGSLSEHLLFERTMNKRLGFNNYSLFFIYRPVQVLAGHDKSVKCVALSAELDMAVSGSEDGTVNIYSIKEGQFMRFLKPPNNAPEMVRYINIVKVFQI